MGKKTDTVSPAPPLLGRCGVVSFQDDEDGAMQDIDTQRDGKSLVAGGPSPNPVESRAGCGWFFPRSAMKPTRNFLISQFNFTFVENRSESY